MAAAVRDSRVSAGKKLKNSLKKRKKMKVVAAAVASELDDKDKDTADNGDISSSSPGTMSYLSLFSQGLSYSFGTSWMVKVDRDMPYINIRKQIPLSKMALKFRRKYAGSVGSCGSENEHFSSSDEAVEADNEDEVEPCDDDSENAAEASVGANAGWADAMAKILNKKIPKSKPTILVKNKELEKEKERLKQERLEKRKQLDKKREWEMMCRVKPDVVKDKEPERNLQRIATRGVVQLFNAVQKHQKNVDEKVKEAGGSVRKRAKLLSAVSKKDFISVLRGMDGAANEKSSTGKSTKARQTEVKAEEGPGWTILRDDFMLGATMKDWDRESVGPGVDGHPDA